MGWLKLKQIGSFPVSYKGIISPYYSGKPTKTNDAKTIGIGKTFVIYQLNIFMQYGLQQFFIVRLLFDGMGKEIRDLIEDIQDEARAELLARQLEYTIARFDFTLLAARSNTLVQSILISQDSSGYGKSTQENASRVGITLNQSHSIFG